MSDLLAAAAAAMGVPEALVERSAAARAAETGQTIDEILAAWAGGETVPAAPAVAAPPLEAPAPVEEAAIAEPAPEEELAEPAPAVIETAAAQPVVATRAPLPTEVTAAEAANLPEVVTVATAGIRERTNYAIPKWLFAVLLVIPVLSLLALGESATGQCGSATELETDVVSGEIVNCDGSEFTGSGVGDGVTDFIAMGEQIYTGAVGGANCAGCHGAGGGGGVGPALNGVLATFGVCADHITWIELGTPGFQAAGIGTYGDTGKPVGSGGTMPGFSALSEEQLAAVSAFERVRFGGENTEIALSDCGLGTDEEAPEGESETPVQEGAAVSAGGAASGAGSS